MAVVTKEFIYTGGVEVADIPHGTTLLTLYLWGGAGGGGGPDAAGPGGSGAAGHYVTKTNFDMTPYAGVKNITVTVGGGGAGGQLGAAQDGGDNGKSLTGYSGGVGGTSGPGTGSGSGGGGGGATLITVFTDGQPITQTVLATAGGGGGGGGSGMYSTGGTGSNTNTPTARTPGTLGENGALHESNGGGGGAGGGGADGGTGGSGDVGNIGGFGGRSGSNLVPSSGSADDGSGITPGGTGIAQYGSDEAAVGGAGGHSGKNGRAVLIFTIPSEAKYKVSGDWKNITEIYNKVSGTWKRFIAGYEKVSGEWKAIFANDVLFTTNFAGFGDDNGGLTSGTPGVAGQPGGGSPAAVVSAQDPGGGAESAGSRSVPAVCTKQYWGPITTTCPQGYQIPSNEKQQKGPPPGPPPGGHHPGNSCFVAGTMVSMVEGFKKKIEDVKIGEKVLGFNKQINTVIGYDRPLLGNRKLYSINNSVAFVTNEHPFMTENGWRSIDPDATRKETNRNCDDLTDIAELKIGDKIITDNDNSVIVKKIKEYNGDSRSIVYNFELTGNNTYFADGYCVHNKGGRVICTYFYSKGQFDLIDLQLDTEFSRNYLNDTVKIGYWFWAIPLVKWMEKHEQSTHWWPKLVIKATKLFAQTRSVEISYKMGGRDKGSILGKLVRLFGETGCYLAGLMIRPFVSDKYATFLKDYKKDVNLIR